MKPEHVQDIKIGSIWQSRSEPAFKLMIKAIHYDDVTYTLIDCPKLYRFQIGRSATWYQSFLKYHDPVYTIESFEV